MKKTGQFLLFIFITFSLEAMGELLPSGTVAAFDLSTCPSGWSMFTPAGGRTLLGAGSGNNDQLGSPLTTRNYGQAGGFEYTTGIKAKVGAGDSNIPSAARFPAATSGSYDLYGNSQADGTNTTISGVKADSNMGPYYIIIHCKKD